MYIWFFIIFLTLGGIAIFLIGLADLRKGDWPVTGIIGTIGGIGVIIYALFPLWGNVMVCEYVPVQGTEYSIEHCEVWEP